jgi:hypothetical protein
MEVVLKEDPTKKREVGIVYEKETSKPSKNLISTYVELD